MMWQMSNRADQEARVIADRHYNRQKVGAPQFVPPGRCMVLKTPTAFWVTSFPFARYVKHAWAGAWVCSAFRNESKGNSLSSEMIMEAAAHTVQFHLTKPSWNADPLPHLGMITFVNENKTARGRSRNSPPGKCFLEAGFKVAGRTKQDDLLALRLPLTSALRLWSEKLLEQ
jgi:hypothetical protein